MVQFAAWMDVYPQHHNCVRTHMGDRWYIYFIYLFIYLFCFNVFMYVLKLYYIYTQIIYWLYIYILVGSGAFTIFWMHIQLEYDAVTQNVNRY